MSSSVAAAVHAHLAPALVRVADVKPPDDKVTPGTIGFFVVAFLAVATWLLIRSMLKHMGRVTFEEKDTRASNGTAPAPSERVDHELPPERRTR